MVTTDPRLRQNYAAAFARFLFHRDEAALSAAYELGRRSLASGVSLLDIVQAHHSVVIDALPGIKVPNLTGGTSEMLPNHHITKPVLIGEVEKGGQFNVVWKTEGLVPGEAWSKSLEGSKDLEADWVQLKCGNYNTKTKKCGGA